MKLVDLDDKKELHFLQKRIDKLKVEQHFCHGIVINEWTVMTAASCLMAGKEPIGIGKGQTRLEAYDGGLTRVLEQIVHIGAYHKQNVPNGYTQSDLAIVKLYSPLSFTPDSPVRPACLNLKASHIHHGSLSAAGLGRAFPQTIYKGMIIPQKIEDLMHTIKRMQFKDISQQRKSCVDHEELMCLESINSSVAICDGDFGTPLHHTMQGLSHVIGLASFSETEDSMGGYSSTCNRRSVFTRLSWNEAWIRKQLGDNFCEVR